MQIKRETMRAFVRLWQMLAPHASLAALEKNCGTQFRTVVTNSPETSQGAGIALSQPEGLR